MESRGRGVSVEALRPSAGEAVKAAEYVTVMHNAGLADEFVAGVLKIAQTSKGAFGMLKLWVESEGDQPERDEVIADLQEMIEENEVQPGGGKALPRISFENLAEVAKEIAEFKRALRVTIDKHGGVTAVAEKTGIPQPSLSRMLSSASMPRQTTLYRIAAALELDESQVATKWRR